MQITPWERRAIMLEQQTPAYALSSDARRAIDSQYRRAKHLRQAFNQAGIYVPVTTRAIVPMQHRFVSGLNVPGNLVTLVGREAINKFKRVQRKAVLALEARNKEALCPA